MKEEQYIVAIGLSAGGLDALKKIIKNLEYNLNATYIIAEHHVDSSKNKLKEILSKLTKIPIHYAKDNELIKPNNIYICPSNKHITISHNKIELYHIDRENTFKPSINWLFESISKYQNKAIAIVLSGALNDGSNGILNVKLNGGMVIIQDPKTASFPMMPQNAIETNLYDFILPPKEIAFTLNKFLKLEFNIQNDKLKIINKIFEILKNDFQVDFNDYKLGTILRRIERRMVFLKINSLHTYLEYLQKHHKEKKALFDDLLIVVTSFCRNRESFKKLTQTLEDYILNSNENLKIWNIGCATGEESYSIAIIIQSILEKYNIKRKFHIFSTDISQKAIDIARIGEYPKNEVESSLPTSQIKYFEKHGDKYIISPQIREHISFANHNILEDTPLTNIDLIVCRNLLIYFKIHAQEKFFSLANYALKENGILFIGKSESFPEKSELLFKTIDSKNKIYQKINNSQPLIFPISYHISKPKNEKIAADSIINVLKENINKIFNTFIIIDNYGNILYTAGEYEKYLKIPRGKFSNNIFSFIDEELNLPLHTIISQTKSKLISINYKIRLNNDNIQYINLLSFPLNEFKKNAIGIFFIPSSNEINSQSLNKNCSEVEHELIETKQKLKHTLEELSTTNEELQTSNEELQSSNEELITTNEELRAVNESLNKTNNELNEYKTKLEIKVKQKTKEFIKEQKKREKIEKNYIKNLKKELNKKVNELRKKDILLQNEYKLARMGELLSNISHQYRQPLNRLSLNLSNIEANIDNISKEDILDCVRKSYNTINFLSETIDDFKNLFNSHKHKDIVNLYVLVENIINFIEIHKTIHNIDIKINIDKNLKIATFPNELTHILLNMIHNAKDAIMEKNPKNPYIKISAKVVDNDIIIKVKDNGGGIKNFKKLFSPYVTTKQNGVGIGLYMSKIIAKERLNAKLWAKNKKNGANFYLKVKYERNL